MATALTVIVLDPGAVHVERVWHLRRDSDPAHRWLREILLRSVRPGS